MNELLERIATDSSRFERHGRLTQIAQRHLSQSNVDGLSEHMQTVFGDAAAVFTQLMVGGRAAKSGNDLESLLTTEYLLRVIQQIEEPGVDMSDFLRVMIAEKVIEGLDRRRQVIIADGIDQRQPFLGVQMFEMQAAGVVRQGGM